MNDLIKYSIQLIDEKSEELIVQEARRNPAKFEPIYRKYYSSIYRMILNKVRDKEKTTDLVADVFCKSLHNLKKFKYQGTSIYFWIYRIALNECNEYFRKQGKTRYVVLEDYHLENFSEELPGLDSEHVDRLKNALKTLSISDLQFIELRFFQGLKFKEMAVVTGTQEAQCKMKVYRAIKRLKKYFTHER